jgi:hypothetical protein
MTKQADSIYCSGLLPVLSIEAIEAEGGAPLAGFVDPGDDPETALIRKQEDERLHDWVDDLPAGLAEVANGLLDDEAKVSIAKRLNVSGAAITKRVRRIAAIGRDEIGDLRGTPLMC